MAGAINQSGNAFNPKVVFGLILFGALAFLATLYFIGAGETGGEANDGGAHGGGKGLNGYAALFDTLEAEGHDVSLSRSPAEFNESNLLILTPPLFAEGDDITAILNERRFVGPTLVIVPKWTAFKARPRMDGQVQEGWVNLGASSVPDWAAELGEEYSLELASETEDSNAERQWQGLGLSGTLPEARYSHGGETMLMPLVRNGAEETLAGYLYDDGYYPILSDAAGSPPYSSEDESGGQWPVTFVIEPDLVNNYGFAEQSRADLALKLVTLAMDGEDFPIVFDLTTNGFGSSQNLLTLAFTAPFLAATLCLILALVVVGWRAFRRFGPPASEDRAIAFGKARLIKNSAGFIQRSKRLHLLSGPYADMIRDRVVRALALRNPDDDAIDQAVAKRAPDSEAFSSSANALRAAKSPNDILRAAAALKSIERKLSK